LLVDLGGGNVVANLEDQTGIVVERSLAAGDVLVLQSEERVGVGIVARGAIGAGGDFGGIRDGDGERVGSAGSAGRRGNEEIAACRTVEVEAGAMLRVEGIGEARSKSVERRLRGSDFLIANLQLPGELAGGDFGGDVGSLGKNVLQASGLIRLSGELKALATDDEWGAIAGGDREAAVASVNF
jgi:hypothetical protein